MKRLRTNQIITPADQMEIDLHSCGACNGRGRTPNDRFECLQCGGRGWQKYFTRTAHFTYKKHTRTHRSEA